MSIFFSLLLTCGATAATDTREGHYRLKMADTSLNPDIRLLYVDSLISVCPESADSLLLLSAEIAYNTGRYRRAISNMNTLLGNQRYHKMPLNRQCEALFMLVKSQFKSDEYADAIESAQRLLDLKKPDSLLYHDINCISIVNDYLSSVTTDTTRFEKSIETYSARAEDILKASKERNIDKSSLDKMQKAILFSKMTLATDRGQYEKSLQLGSEMLRYNVEPIEKLALEGNMAMIYYLMGNLDMASEYYERILSEPGWHINHAICLSNYMHILNYTNQPEKALQLLDSHPEIVEMVKGQYFHAQLLKRKSFALYLLNKTDEAYPLLIDCMAINDSINDNIQGTYAVKFLQTFDTARELREAQKSISGQRIIILLLAVSLAIMAIAGISLWIIIQKRKSKEAHSEVKLTDKETKNETSAVSILHLASLNETVASIASTVDNTGMTDAEKVSQINAQIKEVASYDDLWDIFHLQFEKIHPSFFKKLLSRYPSLTQGETRMCAYVMLNMSNKEIAALTRKNVRSVETMRYRLTKKLQLPQGESLLSHLMSLAESDNDPKA
ncbi:MAG: hypothetical protein HDR88_12670 [Bacteroides sp.]|nr:hypothetical protein [Bacteroides sp.]